jgi:hypothetical protein
LTNSDTCHSKLVRDIRVSMNIRHLHGADGADDKEEGVGAVELARVAACGGGGARHVMEHHGSCQHHGKSYIYIGHGCIPLAHPCRRAQRRAPRSC